MIQDIINNNTKVYNWDNPTITGGNIWFTADLHYDDSRLIGDNPKSVHYRSEFNCVNKMNYEITQSLKKYIKQNDILIVLGDVSVSENGLKWIDNITCQSKILIKGNHEIDKSDEILSNHFDYISDEEIINFNGSDYLLCHKPLDIYQKLLNSRIKFGITAHIHSLWKVNRNLINVGWDCWKRPVNINEILFIINAYYKQYYDNNVFLQENIIQ